MVIVAGKRDVKTLLWVLIKEMPLRMLFKAYLLESLFIFVSAKISLFLPDLIRDMTSSALLTTYSVRFST